MSGQTISYSLVCVIRLDLHFLLVSRNISS